jgi:VRR-NUC domain
MYISILDVAKELGDKAAIKNNDCHIVLGQIQRLFPGVVHKVRISGTGSRGGMKWAILVDDKERILKGLSQVQVAPTQTASTKIDWENRCADELKSQGYVTIVTKQAGTPDVIAFRRRDGGGFDLVFREAKGPRDSLSREQHETLARLKFEGVDADVRWF